MQAKNHIIELGKLLRAEHDRGYDDGAATSGLEEFLADWRARANGALTYPEVQSTLALLNGYADFDDLNRRTRVDLALDKLRTLMRQEAGARSQEPGARSQEPEVRSQEAEDSTQQPAASAQKPVPSSPVTSTAPKRKTQAAKPKAQTPPKPLALDSSIESVTTPKNAQSFRRLGVNTVADLLYHFPHRYEDLSSRKQIADLVIGETSTVVGEVSDVRTFHTKSGRGSVEVRLNDDTGMLKLTFFGQQWLSKQLPVGKVISVSGKVDSYMGMRQMNGPKWEPYNQADDALLHTGRMVPVHSLTKGLVENNARSIIKSLVDRAAPLVVDYLPENVRQRAGLFTLSEAIAQIHFPDTKERLERARLRLGFDEFLLIQLGVLQRKLLWQGEPGYAMPFNADVHQDFLSKLSFKLTGAQTRALDEIFEDMGRPVPMARLLQGDVGSGKTAVAAAAAMQAIASGFQVALMAPTEILAEQHYKGLSALLRQVSRGQQAKQQGQDNPPSATEPLISDEEQQRLDEIKRMLGMMPEDDRNGQGVRVALLTGSLGAKERRRVLEAIANGDVDLIIGTHALITESVRYAQLGLVVVDEQHRFGVEQRQRLKDKGFNPHMLVMTATPIPRTLTLTIYGDLDTTILDELPPGRQEIKTRWVTTPEREKAYRHMRREINSKRQTFVICPLVDESEKVDLPSAEEMYEKLGSEIFPEYRVALLHGKMLPRDKDQVMIAFRNHEFDILVATAVIEVGIDVPNATTIVIEGAERFGLAQLHQFRGRVGRGQHQSYCILISDKDNEVTQQRLGAMETTTDGFKLAEIDLELRGPGEFFGKRQSGTPDLKVAQLADTKLLHAANREARQILADDPQLAAPEHVALKAKVDAFWTDVIKAG